MKLPNYLLCFLLSFAIASCAVMQPSPTATKTTTPHPTEKQKAPTPTRTETATATATEVATGLATAQTLKYDADDLAKFSKVEVKTVTIAGENKKGLVGTSADGKTQVLGLEINGRMTRVGEWKDEQGHSFYVYVNPEYDRLHRILATENSPKTLLERFWKMLAQGQFNGQAQGDGQKMKGIILNPQNNGKISLNLPVDAGTKDGKVKWVTSQTKADFTKPIEVMTVLGDDVEDFLETHLLKDSVIDKQGNALKHRGGGIFVAEDGHIQIVLIDSRNEAELAIRGIPKDPSQKNNAEAFLRNEASWNLFSLLNVLGSYYNDSDGFIKEVNIANVAGYDAGTRLLWDFAVDLK